MSDMYKEVLVSRKTPVTNKLIKGVLILLTVLGILAGMIFFPLFLVGIAAGVASYFIIPKLEVEYEYLYVNGDLDIDAIYSKQKRKRLVSYTVEELELLAPANSHALDFYKNNKESKVRDFTSGDENKPAYILVMNKDKGRELEKLELDQDILADIRRLAPRKVSQV